MQIVPPYMCMKNIKLQPVNELSKLLKLELWHVANLPLTQSTSNWLSALGLMWKEKTLMKNVNLNLINRFRFLFILGIPRYNTNIFGNIDFESLISMIFLWKVRRLLQQLLHEGAGFWEFDSAEPSGSLTTNTLPGQKKKKKKKHHPDLTSKIGRQLRQMRVSSTETSSSHMDLIPSENV